MPMKNFASRFVLFACLALAIGADARGADRPTVLRCLQPNAGSGSAAAVVVADVPLAHTMQVFPVRDGRLMGAGSAELQTQQLLLNLADALGEARSGLDRAVKLNLYVTDAKHVAAAQSALAKYFDGAHKPAVCLVESALPVDGALVAADAVAVSDVSAPAGEVSHFRAASLGGPGSLAHVAVLPPGRKVFISGQAEKGASLGDCTTRTLASLEATLAYLQLTRAHIVQVKSFLTPMANIAEVEKAFTDFFRGGTMPPLVFVEWKGTVPIEIELIAAAGPPLGGEADSIEFITPPGAKASPVFAKVTLVNRGGLIYTSGLYGPALTGAETQVREIFAKLRGLLNESGGDLKHLAKATYYVAKDDASKALNDIRPDYFDPKRPPAASKAMVKGTGLPNASVTLDMIGVVAKP
ncbi:MAG: RidA family protein [Verrucomicrobia bacterium]|nr:RidA family protein [Verrucomicrobiota bacterium]